MFARTVQHAVVQRALKSVMQLAGQFDVQAVDEK
jgi:hypothetical protein